jgi:hypothetical protein
MALGPQLKRERYGSCSEGGSARVQSAGVYPADNRLNSLSFIGPADAVADEPKTVAAERETTAAAVAALDEVDIRAPMLCPECWDR